MTNTLGGATYHQFAPSSTVKPSVNSVTPYSSRACRITRVTAEVWTAARGTAFSACSVPLQWSLRSATVTRRGEGIPGIGGRRGTNIGLQQRGQLVEAAGLGYIKITRALQAGVWYAGSLNDTLAWGLIAAGFVVGRYCFFIYQR